MSRITLDDATLAKLTDRMYPVEVCDSAGNVRGRFIPEPDPAMQPQISDEEIARRIKEGGGRPLADIIADLEKRA